MAPVRVCKRTKGSPTSLAAAAKFRKRYIKLLSSSSSQPTLVKELIKKAPIPVLKLICNAAIHASRGQVKLSEGSIRLFRKQKRIFGTLADKSIPFAKKRAALLQRGGATPLIPILLSAVISSIGPLLFEKIFSAVTGK